MKPAQAGGAAAHRNRGRPDQAEEQAASDEKPDLIVDLATLTGAMVIALGHENAGYFSNDDALSKAFQKAADSEGEGAWRMPLGSGYAKQLKSRVADVKNVGGRPAGS